MSLTSKSRSFPGLLALTLLTPACGDDGAGSSAGDTGDESGDGDGDPSGDGDGDPSGDGDGDPSGDGDGDPSGDGDGDPSGDGDGDGDPSGDGDGDAGPLDVNQDGVVVIGYFAQWGIYDRDYDVWDIPSAVDVVQYAFWDVTATGDLVTGDAYADFDHHDCDASIDPMCVNGTLPWDDALPYYGNLRALNMLQQQRGTKVVLSLGGWTYSTNFSAVAADPALRATLAAACKAAIDTYGFDGIDLDWEFPVEGGNSIPHSPDDKHNFTLLVQDIRTAIGDDKIISAAVSPNPAHANNIEGALLAPLMDHINIMAYDFHGAWDPQTGHNAPLLPVAGDQDFNVTKITEAWLASGFPADQVTLGMPWYGRTWSTVNCGGQGNATTGLGCAAGGAGPGTWEPGIVDYQDVRDNYVGAPGWTFAWDDATLTPTLYNAQAGQFISYDDADSIAAKREFAESKGLAGLMVWELDSDRSGDLLDAMTQ